jgi:PKD repeat protein
VTQYNRNRTGTVSSPAYTYTEYQSFYSPLSITYTSEGVRVTKPAGSKMASLVAPTFNPPQSFCAVVSGLKVRRNTAASGWPTGIFVSSSDPASGSAQIYNENIAPLTTFSQVGAFVAFPNLTVGDSVIPGNWDEATISIAFGAGAVDVTITGFNVYNFTDSDIPTTPALDSSDTTPAWTFTPNSLKAAYSLSGNDEAVNQFFVDCPAEGLTGTTVKPNVQGGTDTLGTITFPRAGRFTIRGNSKYTVTGASPNTSATSSYTVTVPSGTFTADFNSQVNYLDLAVDGSASTYPALDPPSSWTWSWGDGTANATGQQQTHTYATPGTYTVTLTMTSAATLRTSTVTKTVTVVAAPDPANYFTAIADLLSVTFSPSITNGTTYAWDFGDGTSDATQAPVHVYGAAGTYQVVLVVNGSLTATQAVTVRDAYRSFSNLDVLSLEVAVPWPTGTAYNRLPNPNGDQGAWGWLTPVVNSYVTGSSTSNGADDHGVTGAKLIYHSSGAGTQSCYSQAVGASAGQYASAQITAPYIEGYYRMTVEALSSAGAVLGSSSTTAYSNAATLTRTAPYLLPASTASARVRLDFYATTAGATPAAGKVMQFRRAMLATAPTSADLTSNAYLEGVIWQNIIGPTSSITVERSALNLGTLSATVLDSSFDPATSGTLRPGQAVRLRAATEDVSGNPTTDYLFAGTLLKADSAYNQKLSADDPKSTKVTLSATDATTPLTQTAAPNGVSLLSELPAVLEGAGVPYEINGSSGQVPTASIVSVNPNASVLDQVAITRDSTGSYAWVSRSGVLVAVDPQHLPSAPVGIVSEKAYSGVEATFSTANVINSVMINWLRYVPASGDTPASTTAVPYGPFEDADSIAQWGRRSTAQPFTIQGFAETDAVIQARAAAILAANKTPVRTITSVTIPVRYLEDITRGRALLDLYDPVTLTYDRTATNTLARVTKIKHVITTKAWTVTVGFTPDGTVAPPQLVASPPASTGSTSSTPTTAKLAASAAATSVLNLTSTTTDIPGATLTLAVTSTTQRFFAYADFDVQVIAATAGNFVGTLVAGGTIQSAQAIYMPPATVGLRSSVGQSYLITGLTPGNVVFKLQGRSVTSGTYRTNAQHTVLTVVEV